MKSSSSLFLAFLLLASPLRGADKDPVYEVSWTRDGIITGAAALAGTLPYLFAGDLIHLRCPCNPNEVNALDRGAIGRNSALARVLSDGLVAASVASAVVIDGMQTNWTGPFADDMLVLAEVLAVNGAANSIVKHAFPRPLPSVYAGQNPDIGGPEGYRSFYSGHTSTACAALAFTAFTTAQRQSGVVWPWIALGVGAVSVGLLRVEGGRHFYTDIIVGAAAGTAVGIIVPMLHRRGSSGASWVPVPLPGGGMMTMSMRL